jgi:hypothetical protein
MGEWSEYFEDFPEENPANYDKRGRYDPDGKLRGEESQQTLAQRRLTEVLATRASRKQVQST